jgi:PAS domain S-box-containing protein
MTEAQHTLQTPLEERLRFETLLADLSSRFINLPAGEMDSQIEQAQRQVCECLGFDAVVLWQWFDEPSGFFRLTHYHRPLGGPPVPAWMNAEEHFPWFMKQAMEGKVVALSSIDDLPPEAVRDREVFGYFGVKTTLNLPLSTGGEAPFGVLSFNDMRRERTWPESLVKQLRLVGQVFANALARKRTEQALRENEARLSLAADSAGAGLWSLDLASGRFWLTDKARELLNLLPDQAMTLDSFLALVHVDDRLSVQQTVQAVVESGQEGRVEYRVRLDEGRLRWVAARGRVQRNGSGQADRMMGVVWDITARKETEAKLRDLSGRFLSAQEEERSRLAKELHDGISQNLALLAVELDLLGQKPPPARAELKARMEELSSRTKSLLEEVHRLSHGLHPAKLEQLGLAAAVRGFCHELRAGGSLSVEFTALAVPRVLPPEIALCLYRVAQEALWNVVKHSGAKCAAVKLSGTNDAIHLSVSDQGKGFDPSLAPPARSLGLLSMRERVRLVHGEIQWDSKPGEGTRVQVRVPLGAAGES